MNYPALPRSGLPGPRLLRTGLPVSASDLVPDVGTVVPDSAGDVPSQAVRSVPLLPIRHSATPVDARFVSRLNTVGERGERLTTQFDRRGSKVLPHSDSRRRRRCIPSLLTSFVEDGGLAPAFS